VDRDASMARGGRGDQGEAAGPGTPALSIPARHRRAIDALSDTFRGSIVEATFVEALGKLESVGRRRSLSEVLSPSWSCPLSTAARSAEKLIPSGSPHLPQWSLERNRGRLHKSGPELEHKAL
jgi:hypothetical protein